VALHGSWNRSAPAGYAVVALDFDESGRIAERPFLDGFRGADGLIGRPVDVVEGGDGSIYVSDDYAGVIYRVRALQSSSSGD
jgi:glucose/arabinose dehydrogenase